MVCINPFDYILYNHKKQVDIAYFGFQKAFDWVDKDIFLTKLTLAGFSTALLRFRASYLHERKQYFLYKHGTSELYSVMSSIPQGTNLGPLFFLIEVNDLPTNVTKHCTVLMFSYDVKVALPIVNTTALQVDIDNIHNWSKYY